MLHHSCSGLRLLASGVLACLPCRCLQCGVRWLHLHTCVRTVVLKCLMCFLLSLFLSNPPLPSPQMESPVSTPAPPPLHLLATVGNSEISSPSEQIMVRTRSVAVNTSDVALATEPECLGPCEPGTSVNLEGIVWQETEDGKWSGLTCCLVEQMSPGL